MGGRGAKLKRDGKDMTDPEKQEFQQIGTLDRIKVIQLKEGANPNTKIPLYSNTPNTTYLVVAPNGGAYAICYYEDGKLVESIDVYDKRGYHKHYWSTQIHKDGEETQVKAKVDDFDNITPYEREIADDFVQRYKRKDK